MKLNEAQTKLNEATTKMDLYTIAGSLNNRPEHITIDKVTCLGFMNFDYAKKQVQRMIDESKKD